MSEYFACVFNCLTQLLNNILGAKDANQSFSERCHVNAMQGKTFWKYAKVFINFCAFLEHDHCRKAHVRELKRCKASLRKYGVYVGSIKASPYYGYSENDDPDD